MDKVFNAQNIKLFATRVNSATTNLSNDCSDAITIANEISAIIGRAGDSSAANLAGRWSELASAYEKAKAAINNKGTALYNSMNKFSESTTSNEESAAGTVEKASTEISEIASSHFEFGGSSSGSSSSSGSGAGDFSGYVGGPY